MAASSDTSDTFDAAAAKLYAGPREGFIATRAERAAAAKAAGDAELAARIKALRKPSIAAWLVNRLAREHADEVARLADLGEELREAHADLDGDRLRELSTQRRAAIDGLAERARALGADASGPPGDAIIDQVSGTLESVTADADAAARVAAGRLDAAIAPSGFEAWLVAPVGTGPRRDTRDAAKATLGASGAPKGPLAAPSSPRERARKEKLAAAREREETAEAARQEAEERLSTAEDAAEVAAATAAELQVKLAAAEREARKRREAASTARRAHDEAVRAAAQARREVQRLEPG